MTFKGLVFKDPKTLKLAPTNVRIDPISETEYQEIKNSIMTEGIKEPIIINTRDEVVSGGIRWRVALDLGLPEIPCIVKEFRDNFEERITCFVQDDLHNPLSDRDKGEFVRKAIVEDGKTIEEIASSVGKSPQAVRAWARMLEIPEVIEDKPKTVQTYLMLPSKKKLAVQAILKSPQFRDKPEQSVELVEKSDKLSLRALEEIRKDVSSGVPIDIDFRIQLDTESTRLLEIKIPDKVYLLFNKRAKLEGKDPKKVIVALFELYAQGKVQVEV